MFKIHTKKEKQDYAKQFSKKELNSYRKGKRMGFLEGVHKSPKKASKKYSKKFYDSLFTDIREWEV